MPSQTEAGKAFEYAILNQSYNLLSARCNVSIKEDSSFHVAENCFSLFSRNEQLKYLKAASAAVRHIVDLEPRLENPVSSEDVLMLQIVADSEGIRGDVRDVLFIRSTQNWEIGISAKNNHRAVKHSRLSDKIDFGKEWLEQNCSSTYFKTVVPIFSELRKFKEQNELWRDLKNKHERFYIPILEAFRTELLRLDKANINKIPSNLLSYLIGNKDFYKVIKRSGKTEVYGFNLYGVLNKSADKIRPTFKVTKLKLPTRIIELSFKPNSTDTVILTCDEGWQISFRIHNASSRVEPSLKFDINLIGQPQTLYSHHLPWKINENI
ncbi:MAG: HaeIII family restriction endonuclease [Chitinophagaceae bacterium]|nr:HaeIII family restriction endonuclease [Chitinophagaceae bacterium]